MAKSVASFHSTTRANTRLLKLTRAGLLRRFFIGTVGSGRKALYTPTEKASALIAVEQGLKRKQDQTVIADLFVEHELAVAEIFVTVHYMPIAQGTTSKRWRTFDKPVSASGPIPDGYFELETAGATRAHFLEVDLGTETLKVWQKKIASYIQLAASEDFLKIFGQQQFRVLVVMRSERRLAHLRSVISNTTTKIFWLTTFELVSRNGFWSAIWLRPTGDQRHSLL
ncbi:MAG TPA: replication-relaxation family protein [Bryobacteraceae bacterium]|nr:replication-relaxation family protein [Bryobacteraceae bacterium]